MLVHLMEMLKSNTAQRINISGWNPYAESLGFRV